jgi:Na+-transporting methylmalonyl-CoA/oxaloacetate decarboxylase gamma subunit
MDQKRKWLLIIGMAIVLLSLASIIYATSNVPFKLERIELSPTLFSPP